MRRQSVTTTSPLTPEQSQRLIELGCKPTPYFARADLLLFAAQPTVAGIAVLKTLDFVVSVVDMPVYGIC